MVQQILRLSGRTPLEIRRILTQPHLQYEPDNVTHILKEYQNRILFVTYYLPGRAYPAREIMSCLENPMPILRKLDFNVPAANGLGSDSIH